MSLPGRLDLVGKTWGVYRGDTWGPKRVILSRVVRDANGALGDATLTSATANFQAEDVGIRVVPLLPSGVEDPSFGLLTIASRTNVTTVELSAALPAALTDRLVIIMRKDLTGHTFTANIKASIQAAPVLAVIDCSIAGDPKMGLVDLFMDKDEAEFTLATNGVWDLQSEDAAGVRKTWLKGIVASDPDVTP